MTYRLDDFAYDLGIVNIALFGWAVLLASDYVGEPVAMVIAFTGLGLVIIGMTLLLIDTAEKMFGPPERLAEKKV